LIGELRRVESDLVSAWIATSRACNVRRTDIAPAIRFDVIEWK